MASYSFNREPIIDILINKTRLKEKLIESDQHKEVIINKKTCIRCTICGARSGTLKIIPHTYSCIYYIDDYVQNIQLGTLSKNTNKLNKTNILPVLQREYGTINKNSKKKIIGSYGAGPCVILCMRAKNSQTTLAHIDGDTRDIFIPFEKYKPRDTNVYIVGGSNESRTTIYDILCLLRLKKFEIKYADIISNHSNSFAINCVTEEIYLNDNINTLKDFPQITEKTANIMKMMILTGKSPLRKVC
tara:strand:+ start:1480 stop:2214 length:735 start_codon:yes stop_codon:yes gene_type:complete